MIKRIAEVLLVPFIIMGAILTGILGFGLMVIEDIVVTPIYYIVTSKSWTTYCEKIYRKLDLHGYYGDEVCLSLIPFRILTNY